MARTTINPLVFPISGVNLTDLEFDVIPSTIGNGVQFKWHKPQLSLLYNPDDSQPPGHFVWVNDTPILQVGGLVLTPLLLVEITEIHVIKTEDIFRQPNGMMYIDSAFGSFIKVINL